MTVSASVEETLTRALQQDLDRLREEHVDVCSALNEATRAQAATARENDELKEEIARLRNELLAAKANNAAGAAASAASDAPPPPALHSQLLEELAREVATALDEALGADSDTLEGARGAARRRAGKPASSVAAAAVRTAKRAQATWAAQHAKLETQALEHQRSAAARAAELEEAQAAIRRLRSELNASRRGMQDYQLAESRRLEALEQQLQQQQQQALQAAASSAAASRQAPAPAEPRQQMSQFAAYMQEKQQQSAGPAGGAGGGSAGSMLRSPSDATAPTRLPALKTPAAGRQPPPPPLGPPPLGTLATADVSSLRSMTEALSRKWQSHVQSQAGWGGQQRPVRRY